MMVYGIEKILKTRLIVKKYINVMEKKVELDVLEC